MRNNMSGLIINVTSIAGYLGLPFQSIYCASKSSLNLLGESLNMELKNFNIRVVNLAPGDYKTEIIENRTDAILDNNSPYKSEYSSFTKAVTKGMTKKGNDPKEISDLVFKIIKSKNPKIHYLSGKFIQKLVTLKEFIPDMIFEKIIMKLYKLK
jgi:short-subunit dehydrogenase